MKHYLSHLRQKKPIDVKKSFVEIQTELDRISPLSSIIGDIETSLGKENKDLRHLKMKVLLSEMKGKEEATGEEFMLKAIAKSSIPNGSVEVKPCSAWNNTCLL